MQPPPPSPSVSRHAYLKPLFWVLAVPAAVVLFQPVVLSWYFDWRLMVVILGPFVIVARGWWGRILILDFNRCCYSLMISPCHARGFDSEFQE
jgi:hypothetical protein